MPYHIKEDTTHTYHHSKWQDFSLQHGRKNSAERPTQTMQDTPFGILPPEPSSVRDFRANARRYQLPPVEQWIRSFMDAEIVITDSFHGTVFSIIFNKPFICIGNESRGDTRFSSLNEIFGLSDQFISSARDLPDVVPVPEWGAINREICRRRERAMSYLRQHLL